MVFPLESVPTVASRHGDRLGAEVRSRKGTSTEGNEDGTLVTDGNSEAEGVALGKSVMEGT